MLFSIILQAVCFSEEGGPKASLVLYEVLQSHIDTSWSNKRMLFFLFALMLFCFAAE